MQFQVNSLAIFSYLH